MTNNPSQPQIRMVASDGLVLRDGERDSNQPGVSIWSDIGSSMHVVQGIPLQRRWRGAATLEPAP